MTTRSAKSTHPPRDSHRSLPAVAIAVRRRDQRPRTHQPRLRDCRQLHAGMQQHRRSEIDVSSQARPQEGVAALTWRSGIRTRKSSTRRHATARFYQAPAPLRRPDAPFSTNDSSVTLSDFLDGAGCRSTTSSRRPPAITRPGAAYRNDRSPQKPETTAGQGFTGPGGRLDHDDSSGERSPGREVRGEKSRKEVLGESQERVG